MLAAALPIIGGIGVGGCAYALRLQNDCFVWLRAPFPPRALAVAALAFRRLALRSVRGAAAVGVRTAAAASYSVYSFRFFFSTPLTRALHCATIIDAPTEVVA